MSPAFLLSPPRAEACGRRQLAYIYIYIYIYICINAIIIILYYIKTKEAETKQLNQQTHQNDMIIANERSTYCNTN